MSGKLFVHCPICSTENHIPADANKIIDCGSCGAPVYNANRPCNGNDIKDYQLRLEKWGKEKQIEPQAVIARHDSQLEQRREEQSENTRLNAEVVSLRSEVNLWKTKAASWKQGAASHAGEIEKLNASVAVAEDSYQRLQADNQKLKAELLALARDVEGKEQQAEHCLRNIISEGLANLKEANVSFNQPILARIDNLISMVSTDNDGHNWKERSWEESHQQVQPPGEKVSPSEQDVSPSEQEVSSIEDRVSNVSATPAAVVQNKPIPAWLSDYNALSSPPAAKSFKERYQAKKLTVPQNSLEHQRIAPDSGAPVFVEGEGIGSYWCIHDPILQTHFLLLDRERFRFNSANYESITVCYDFNGYTQDQLQHFAVSEYILNSYRIVYPAQIAYITEQAQWKLSSRGAIDFEMKPQPEKA